MYPIPLHHEPELLNEEIFPIADDLVSVWEDEGGATSNLYQSVDDVAGDSDYITLRNANLIIDVCPTEATRTFRFLMDEPSGPVSNMQDVFVGIRARIEDPFTTGYTADVDVRLKQGGTQIAADLGNSISGTFAEIGFGLTAQDIGEITDWTDLYIEATFNVCASGVDADLSIECSGVYLDLTI